MAVCAAERPAETVAHQLWYTRGVAANIHTQVTNPQVPVSPVTDGGRRDPTDLGLRPGASTGCSCAGGGCGTVLLPSAPLDTVS